MIEARKSTGQHYITVTGKTCKCLSFFSSRHGKLNLLKPERFSFTTYFSLLFTTITNSWFKFENVLADGSVKYAENQK